MPQKGRNPGMNRVDVYFDYASPFAYIASEILPGFSDRVRIAVHWKPIALEGLSNYADGLPYSSLKRRYVGIDAARSAEFHGVRIHVPKPHPVRSEAALRLAVVALPDPRFQGLHRALFRAAWRDQLDLSSEEVLADCIAQAKGPVDAWLAQANRTETARELDAFTQEAEENGVFGVPSILLDGELFWGIDSLPILEWRIATGTDGESEV